MQGNPYLTSLNKDVILPASYTATQTSSVSVDTKGWTWLRVKAHLGAWTTDETVTLTLQDSADDSSFAAVSGGPSIGPYGASATAGDQSKEILVHIPSGGLRRYIKVTATHTGTGAFVYGVECELLGPENTAMATQTPAAKVIN